MLLPFSGGGGVTPRSGLGLKVDDDGASHRCGTFSSTLHLLLGNAVVPRARLAMLNFLSRVCE